VEVEAAAPGLHMATPRGVSRRPSTINSERDSFSDGDLAVDAPDPARATRHGNLSRLSVRRPRPTNSPSARAATSTSNLPTCRNGGVASRLFSAARGTRPTYRNAMEAAPTSSVAVQSVSAATPRRSTGDGETPHSARHSAVNLAI